MLLVAVWCRKLENPTSCWAMSGFPGLLPQQALQQGASGAAIGKVTLFIAEEAAWRPPVWLSAWRPKIGAFFPVIGIQLAARWVRRRLCSS